MAVERVGRLFHAAALLADRPTRTELSGPAEMVGLAKRQRPTHLAGKLSRQGHGHADWMARAGAAGSDRRDARTTWSYRERLLQHAQLHVRTRQSPGKARGRPVWRKSAGSGIDVAGQHSTSGAGRSRRSRCQLEQLHRVAAAPGDGTRLALGGADAHWN